MKRIFANPCQSILRFGNSKMWGVSFLVVLALGIVQARIRLDPLVDTQQGLIKGLRADDGDYSMFLGIPYAKVDMDNPFGASVPHPKFTQVFDAYDDSVVCPQIDDITQVLLGKLECLNLNVYVPNKASSKNKLPVLVWIHGGGYQTGTGHKDLHGPRLLVGHDIILVSINYRLGPYGFMSVDSPEIPGNQGLKDQRLALRWVKNNIAAFGGDVNKITIMGESAGASSVELHLINQQEKLFSQAIMQSGSAFSPWVIEEVDLSRPLKIAERLGFQTENLSEALDFLKSADFRLVVGATFELGIQFRVCVEKQFDNVESILIEYPINMDYPKAKNISILSGFNNREFLFKYGDNQKSDLFKNVNVFDMKNSFNYDEEFQEMENIMKHFYIGEEEISVELRSEIIDFASDYNFNYPSQKSVAKLLEYGAENVYQYLFSYDGGRNFLKKRDNITLEGASHVDELGYLFDMMKNKAQPSEADQQVIDQITTLWTNFVKYGDPTPELSELLPVKWLPITKDSYNYLEINEEPKMIKRPFHDRLAFWELFNKVNENKLKGKRVD